MMILVEFQRRILGEGQYPTDVYCPDRTNSVNIGSILYGTKQ